MPLFEAVVNAIQAMEERGNLATGKVTVEIERSTQKEFEPSAERPITGFKITDEGIGFNDENFESFQTSGSDHKISLGGKGIGRLLWLKAFERVLIKSVFENDGSLFKREFDFSVTQGIG